MKKLEPARPFRWTYFSALLKAEDGRKWGYSLCVFHPDGARPFTHVGLLDVQTGKFESAACWGDRRGCSIVIGKMYVDLLPGLGPDHGSPIEVDHGERITAVGRSRHRSFPDVRIQGHISEGEFGEQIPVTGRGWADHEEGLLIPGTPWTWLSIRYDDGKREMVYDIGGDTYSWYEGKEASHPLSKVTRRLGAKDGAVTWAGLTITPVAPGQFIKDPNVSGFSYLEALCWVTNEKGERVGHAYLEILPEGWGAQPRSSIEEARLVWAHGNQSAADFLKWIIEASQIADDFVDNEVKGHRPQAMVELATRLLFLVPENPFYVAHRDVLAPVLSMIFVTWSCTDEWAASQRKDIRTLGYAWRETMLQLIGMVGLITGGPAGGRESLLSAVDFFHGPGGAEDFDFWDNENASRRR